MNRLLKNVARKAGCKAHGAERPRHINRIGEGATTPLGINTAQRSRRLSAVVFQQPVKGERGFALVITLVVTALLVALVTEFIHDVYVATSWRATFKEAQQASLLAESGMTGGLRLLRDQLAIRQYSSLMDKWAQPFFIENETGSVTVTIEEENGKLCLPGLIRPDGSYNPVCQGIVTRLGKRLELPPELWAAAADWMDGDDETRTGGAEASYYNSLQPPYAPANRPLQTVDELGLVKGFAGGALEKLRPFVTVYPDVPGTPLAKININTAPKELLLALDEQMSEDLASRIVEYRSKTPFNAPGELAGKIQGMETLGVSLQGLVGVKGNVYRLRSVANVGGTSRIIEAVARIEGSQPKILYWREL